MSGTGLEIDGIGPNNPQIDVRSGHFFLWDGTRALMGPRMSRGGWSECQSLADASG